MSEATTLTADEAGRLIENDPAFAAMEVSGAPIFALADAPPRVIYANRAARLAFGGDCDKLQQRLLGEEEAHARRLIQLTEALKTGAAPRLERVLFAFGSLSQTVTLMCRRLADEHGASCFVAAALGLRAPEAAAIASSSSPLAGLREGLRDRFGLRNPRFLWRTDANGRFVDVTPALAEVVGAAAADILGRSVDEVSNALRLGPDLPQALDRRRSWSGVEVRWPLDDFRATIGTTLGALPIFDRKSFQGFQGYGVMHLTRIRPREPQGAVTEAADAAHSPTAPADSSTAPTDAPQTPVETPPRSESPPIEPPPADFPPGESAPARPPLTEEKTAPTGDARYQPGSNVVELRSLASTRPQPDSDAARRSLALSAAEQDAFAEIARALSGAGDLTPGSEPSASDVAPAQPPLAEPPAARGADLLASGEPPAAMRDILDRLPVGALVARGDEALFANRTLLDYLGYPTLDALNRAGGLPRMFLGPTPREEGMRAPFGAVEIQTAAGEALEVDAHLQTFNWSGPATLITLRRSRMTGGPTKHLEEAVARADEALSRATRETALLSAIFTASPEAVACIGASGVIEAANDAFGALLGIGAEALAGRPIDAFLARADWLRLREFLAGDAEADLWAGSFRTQRAEFTSVDLCLKRLCEKGAAEPRAPEPAGRFVALFPRVAPTAQSLGEIEDARSEAERASAAKSQFLARVSHEIRTPLNAIIGFAEVMMEERFGPIGSERYKEYLKDVHSSGKHVLSLVNDLLDLSKIEAGKLELFFESVDVNAAISECVSIMQPQANGARIIIRVSLAPHLPRVRADARSLRQILLNLLSNAVKFNEPGGQVIVSSATNEAGCVLIRVKDTGLGMSEQEVGVALEPFKQIDTSRMASGTGLGLPLTKALIEANHASFTIRSRRNEGTLIEIAFPPPQVLAAE